MLITYGLNGSINYKAYTSDSVRIPAIYYRATGDMGSSASLKVRRPFRPTSLSLSRLPPRGSDRSLTCPRTCTQIGNYRRFVDGQLASSNYIGDFVQTRIS